MMLLWACAGVPLGAYNIAGGFNVALLIQPQILTVLSLVTWGQCWYYDDVSFSFVFDGGLGRAGGLKMGILCEGKTRKRVKS